MYNVNPYGKSNTLKNKGSTHQYSITIRECKNIIKIVIDNTHRVVIFLKMPFNAGDKTS